MSSPEALEQVLVAILAARESRQRFDAGEYSIYSPCTVVEAELLRHSCTVYTAALSYIIHVLRGRGMEVLT